MSKRMDRVYLKKKKIRIEIKFIIFRVQFKFIFLLSLNVSNMLS